jgi:hypothetical protein
MKTIHVKWQGEKIFYLIEPTDENLQKYADWSRSPNESETFLGDCVSHCYKMHLREDNTVFIPAGFVHTYKSQDMHRYVHF